MYLFEKTRFSKQTQNYAYLWLPRQKHQTRLYICKYIYMISGNIKTWTNSTLAIRAYMSRIPAMDKEFTLKPILTLKLRDQS